MKVRVEEMDPGKEVVLSVVIVACSSGLSLVSSLIGPWHNTHALMIRPFHVRPSNALRSELFGVSRHRYHYRQISDTIAMFGLRMCEYVSVRMQCK
jgi:hypothetical protein